MVSIADDQGMPASLDDHIKKFDDFFEKVSPLAGDLSEPSEIVNKITSMSSLL